MKTLAVLLINGCSSSRFTLAARGACGGEAKGDGDKSAGVLNKEREMRHATIFFFTLGCFPYTTHIDLVFNDSDQHFTFFFTIFSRTVTSSAAH